MRMEKVAKMGYNFFKLASEDILSIIQLVPSSDEVMKDAFKLAWMDVGFLRLFYLWLAQWEFTTDEKSREILKSMISVLEERWGMEDYKGLRLGYILSRLRETHETGVGQHYHTVDFGLETGIQQSKLQIEEWCGNLLHCSVMQSKASTCSEISQFLRLVYEILDDFLNCEAAEIVTLKKQICVFKGMISFMHGSLEKVQHCTEIEFMNFVGAFSLKAACLAFLYWAKEAYEETANEMNIALFDMMQHEFIPFAPDVIECYFDILKSQNLDVSETVASFVDFFFEHLATTIMKDDFLIFRDQMISLFTIFLAEESSDKSIILSDFLIKIETVYAKARLHYYGFSDSWIGFEAAKMVYIYFHSVQRELYLIEKHSKWAHLVQSQLNLYRIELRFLRAFLLWIATCDDSDEEIRERLSSMIVSLQGIWGKEEEEEEKGLLVARLSAIPRGKIIHWYMPRRDIDELCRGYLAVWHPFDIELQGKIQLSKLEIEAWLVNWFHCSIRSNHSTSNKILKFLDSILNTLNDLVNYKADKIVSFKKQIETLKDKLVFLQNWLKLTEHCIYTKELGEFNMCVQVFAMDAACLIFLYWVKEANDINAPETNYMLSDMLQKIKPVTPDVARLYFGTLKAIYSQRSDSLLFGQTASIFIDIVFEDLETLFKDDFQNLRDDVIFLLTFLNDPPSEDAGELICCQIDNHFWEGIYGLLPIDDMKEGFSEKKVLITRFMKKIETLNANILKHYCEFLDSPLSNLPKIASPWHLDFLIQNVKNLKERMNNDCKFVPFAKYKINKFEKELVSFSHFFNYIFELQNELNDAWLQVVGLVHLTERVINSCISSWFVFDHPIWYYMAYLSHVIDRIMVVKTKLEKIKENNTHNVRRLPHSVGVNGTLSKQAWNSEINEVVVGFEDEAKIIIDDLTRGHKSFDVVSIVGMGGLGKTTLAKKVSSLVKDQFNIFAFYSISQDHNIRMLLLGVLKFMIKIDDKIHGMTNDDLAHKLWKCLSRQQYLIVLDDIWNISIWNEVKRSFPDNQNGSRVMFTTRFHDVANKCQSKCSPLHLRFLSKVESWELLQKKLFQNDILPPYLSNIGRQIAESCKGLPLAIVVITGILAKKERSESSWSEIAENVFSYLSDEGCMKILELSYNHLPEYLKPCLLYLGAYPEDTLIRVNQVIRLWIAEGFVHESETKSIEDVAKEYFHDLVERSLIIVSARSFGGEIKTFSIHDLIHNMCQTKCHEGNFFKIGREIEVVSSNVDQYRISVIPATIGSRSSKLGVGDANTLLLFGKEAIHEYSSIRKLRLAQVLYAEDGSNKTHFRHFASLVNLRHLHVSNLPSRPILSSISNLWNLHSLILTYGDVDLPETLWKMKSLRHVKVIEFNLKFSDGDEKLDNVVRFSTPRLSDTKDVERLLQRLPAVRKLRFHMYLQSNEKRIVVEPLDIYRKLESLRIYSNIAFSKINFPTTLKKLLLCGLQLPSTTISVIAELQCLRVLRLLEISFMRPRLEMEDVVFESLVFIQLYDSELVEWNASAESFPCLEQLQVECGNLEELPSSFGEITTLKKITVLFSPRVKSSAFRIQEEQLDLGIQVEVDVYDNHETRTQQLI